MEKIILGIIFFCVIAYIIYVVAQQEKKVVRNFIEKHLEKKGQYLLYFRKAKEGENLFAKPSIKEEVERNVANQIVSMGLFRRKIYEISYREKATGEEQKIWLNLLFEGNEIIKHEWSEG